jgi:hypothetical protein
MHVPPFNIPNLRIEQRKTSSAEDMARKNSTGECHSRAVPGSSPDQVTVIIYCSFTDVSMELKFGLMSHLQIIRPTDKHAVFIKLPDPSGRTRPWGLLSL